MGQCYFSGSNSGEGFYNRFDGIVPTWGRLTRYFMIKGGPGVGKSTLMKRVAAKAEEAGEEVELFYCSGDPDSLDGVRLVNKGIVFADATAPHAMDPKFPGAVEEIVNLGEQINRKCIVKYRDRIEQLCKRNKMGYDRAYAFLRAARALQEQRHRELTECIDKKKIVQQVTKIAERIGTEAEEETRYLFLDAISCKGRISFAQEQCKGNRVYRVLGEEKDVITDVLARELKNNRKEFFCSPLCPGRVSHVLLSEKELFLTSDIGTDGTLLSSEEFLLKSPDKIVECYLERARCLEEEAMLCLKECKAIHDELESIYKECVDFATISERTEGLLAYF